MLRHLRIRDLAIIQELEVDFEPGFSVLSGETGAGKSILLGAVQLLLGARAGADWVRKGAEQGMVEAIFDLRGRSDLAPLLEAADLPLEGDELLVRRVIRRDGKNRALLNGTLCPLGRLAEICSRMVDISGQHEHQRLLRPESHVEILDAFGRLDALRDTVAQQYRALVDLRREREALDLSERERLEREGFLRFQVDEIDGLRLTAGEEQELERERLLLRHGEKLALGTRGAVDALYEGDGAATERLAEAERLLADLESVDERLAAHRSAIERARLEVEEAATELRRYAEAVEADPARQEDVEQRLSAIHLLCRKHGKDTHAVLARRDELASELHGLARREERLAELAADDVKLASRLGKSADKLSARRRTAAGKLSREVTAALRTLAMPDAEFAVSVEPAAAEDAGRLEAGKRFVGPDGADRVELLFGPNPGEGLKPLLKIASGGELSRAMLAVKQALVSVDPVASYVFDEVDAGIGGAVAEVVGRALTRVSAQHQVLCVTHLPQIASQADRHYRVTKRVRDGRTVSSIEPLADDAARVEEIARMLGGIDLTDRTREHAREMLRYRQTPEKG